MSTTELRDDEPDVQVCRSKLDPEIWFCYAGDMIGLDMSDFEMPGRVRAVKRYAEREYADGRRVRWERVGDDSWRMRLVKEK